MLTQILYHGNDCALPAAFLTGPLCTDTQATKPGWDDSRMGEVGRNQEVPRDLGRAGSDLLGLREAESASRPRGQAVLTQQ